MEWFHIFSREIQLTSFSLIFNRRYFHFFNVFFLKKRTEFWMLLILLLLLFDFVLVLTCFLLNG